MPRTPGSKGPTRNGRRTTPAARNRSISFPTIRWRAPPSATPICANACARTGCLLAAIWRSRRHKGNSRSGGGGRLRGFPQLGQEIVEVVRAHVLELREDSLDYPPLPALAIVLAAIERRHSRHVERDAKGAIQGLGQARLIVEGFEAERPRIVDQQPRVVDGNARERRERGLDQGEIADAECAQDDRGRKPTRSLEMGDQLQRLARRRAW